MSEVLFLRSVNPEYDARLNKFMNALAYKNISCEVLWWNRLGESLTESFKFKENSFSLRGKLGSRWLNLFNLISWNLFILIFLYKNKKSFFVIHAVDLDCIVSSFIFAKLFRKKIIFDVYDKYADAKSFSGIFGKTLSFAERFFMRNSNITILVDDCRYEQHQIECKENICVIENVPNTHKYCHGDLDSSVKYPLDFNKITLGYFGSLEAKHRGIEDVVEAVINKDDFTLLIAGYGELSEYLLNVSSSYPDKIKFYGRLNSDEGLKLMRQCDIYVGLYYKTNINHLWAAPNKYYEHLMLGIPLLTTLETPPGVKVENLKTGWAIDEGVSEIIEMLESVARDEICQRGNKAFEVWCEKYSDYYSNNYLGIYVSKVNSLLLDI